MHATSTIQPGPTRAEDTQESVLLAGLRAGDEHAFETLVRTYGGRMLAVARRIVRDEDDARDIVQSAYLSAFRSVGQFEGHCLISTWLHRIVVNTALMQLRSRRRRPETSIDDLLPAFLDDGHHVEQFSDWSTPADELIERDQTRVMVRACIDRLPDNYREVLILRDVEELSTDEVSRLLAMTPTAVKVRLHRARQALSTLLRKEFARPPVSDRCAGPNRISGEEPQKSGGIAPGR
jgi:RNA polymerase sigma-70 factor, ECF subfamily